MTLTQQQAKWPQIPLFLFYVENSQLLSALNVRAILFLKFLSTIYLLVRGVNM